MKKAMASLMVVMGLVSGCAGYDEWAENTNHTMNAGWTELLNGKQTFETKGLPAGMKLTLRYGKGEGTGIPGRAASKFYDKLLGEVTYTRACQHGLSFNVALYNSAGAVIRTESVFLDSVVANTPMLINKDVITDPTMSKSSQVTRLVASGFRCS